MAWLYANRYAKRNILSRYYCCCLLLLSFDQEPTMSSHYVATNNIFPVHSNLQPGKDKEILIKIC